MSTEFGFLVMDANQRIEAQQAIVRQLVSQRIDFARYYRRSLTLPPGTIELKEKSSKETTP
jgi:hypothetical protein